MNNGGAEQRVGLCVDTLPLSGSVLRLRNGAGLQQIPVLRPWAGQIHL